MHPTHLDVLTRLLDSVRLGQPWPDQSGLSVIPLTSRDPPAVRIPASLRESRGARFSEHRPPRADAVVAVRGLAGGTTIARIGDVIAGGLSDRAVARTTAIGGERHVDLPVVALESRWWPDGELVAGGALPASLLTLTAQAILGGDAVIRAAAQTALWSSHAAGGDAAERRVRGFVLVADDRAVALHVSSHDMTIAAGGAPGVNCPRGLTRAAGPRVMRGLLDRVGCEISVDSLAPPLVEVWVFEPGRVVSAAMATSGTW